MYLYYLCFSIKQAIPQLPKQEDRCCIPFADRLKAVGGRRVVVERLGRERQTHWIMKHMKMRKKEIWGQGEERNVINIDLMLI